MIFTIFNRSAECGGGGGGLAMSDSCDPMDCSLPGSSVHGISQARILEWVAISHSRYENKCINRTICVVSISLVQPLSRVLLFVTP